MSGGVHNLRAMFENKNSEERPEDRGRSPGGSSMGGASTGTSPRPLSKVRTSFVAVERSGQLGNQMGLRRDTSGEPSISRRRSSFSIEGESTRDMSEPRQATRPDIGNRQRSSLAEETIAESPIEKQPLDTKMQAANGSPKKGEAVNPVASKTDEKPASANGTTSTATKPNEKPAMRKVTSKPASISTAKPSAASKPSPNKSLKSPAPPKTPTTPSRATKKEPPTKAPAPKTSKASVAPNHTSKPTSKPLKASVQGSAPKTRIQESPPQTGFKKPRPKSPTRPVKLPASLTAPTASSVSKTTVSPPAAARQSLSRASGNTQHTNSLAAHHAASRSPSRASVATTKSTLGRKPSTLKQSSNRPSLGPPPAAIKKQPSRTSLPHQPAPADDSFLARMMRPTTASASKTAEKPATTSPPKRAPSVKRPITRDGLSKPNDSSKGSPARKIRDHVPAKVLTKSTKPMEKALKTPTSTIASAATKTTPKRDPKTLKKASSAAEPAKPLPKEKKPVEGKPQDTSSVEQPAISEEAAEADAQPEPSTDKAQAVDEQAAAVEELAKEEPTIPETIQEEPVVEKSEVSQEVTSESAKKPSIEPVGVKGEAPKVEKAEAVDDNAGKADVNVSEPQDREPSADEARAGVVDDDEEEEEEEEEEGDEEEEEEEEDSTKDVETPSSSSDMKHDAEIAEDPEDAKARQEVERLNAEFAKLAVEKETTVS
ncbi:hypothetical protein GLAREA_06944 [Glarea lozoyensis ATCC 20868]|uniref:Uncharacterized protein n=1 Tax=Glarea lozoyensis (strain ATCC 20868 / MF5171) TaxID=1116229 RepID=S3DPA5_GLAL2|nr:uncharacterized protein GLAREA_06944 [Glarea lozoyensis ATCC 20868]EPE33931.1 hypothetical protein GLAREA_06944 [Glarea lozoyensis ATCC 20868]